MCSEKKVTLLTSQDILFLIGYLLDKVQSIKTKGENKAQVRFFSLTKSGFLPVLAG